MTAPLWCEARCDGLVDADSDTCRQTAPGAFGAKDATRAARRCGWRIVGGRWLCPACQSRKAAATATTEDLTHDQHHAADQADPDFDV